MGLKIPIITPSDHIYGMNRIRNCVSPPEVTEKGSISKNLGKFIRGPL